MNFDAIPLSLYIHWPWCVQKCPYCDFNSHRAPIESLETAYVHALIEDLRTYVQTFEVTRPLQSIFIGGGTPSLMSGQSVAYLLQNVQALVPFSDDIEITLEANPGASDESKFAAFKAAGVNRLSIGVQSFDNERLKRLGRIHSREDALRAIEAAHKHFDNFNLDIMFALPGQSLPDLALELTQALNAQSTHLSCYQLTIEPGTHFAKRLPAHLPDEDTIAEQSDWVHQALTQQGFDHYEISGYARSGFHCRHNLNYWQFGDYMGIGAGAHGKMTTPNGIYRQARISNPQKWLQAIADHTPSFEAHRVPIDEQGFEFMLNALRLRHGVPTALLTQRTQLTLHDLYAPLSRAQRKGLLHPFEQTIQATDQGLLFLSDLQSEFL